MGWFELLIIENYIVGTEPYLESIILLQKNAIRYKLSLHKLMLDITTFFRLIICIIIYIENKKNKKRKFDLRV